MSTGVQRLYLAGNIGLSRFSCRKCKEETLHHRCTCVHCGTEYQIAIDRSLSMSEALQIESLVAKNSRGGKRGKRVRSAP